MIYMERLEEIKRQIFAISSLDDYMNALSAAALIGQEMEKVPPSPEEADLMERICEVLEHDPREFQSE